MDVKKEVVDGVDGTKENVTGSEMCVGQQT